MHIRIYIYIYLFICLHVCIHNMNVLVYIIHSINYKHLSYPYIYIQSSAHDGLVGDVFLSSRLVIQTLVLQPHRHRDN